MHVVLSTLLMAKDEETVTLSYSDRFRDKMKDDFDEKEDCEY